MTTRPTILYIRPTKGGIGDYGRQIEELYKLAGFKPILAIVDEYTSIKELSILAKDVDLAHFEIGAGDSKSLSLSRSLLRDYPALPQLITIHDPGVVVYHPIDVPGTSSAFTLLRITAKVARKLINAFRRHAVITAHLNNPLVSKIYLRADLASESHAHYLPQPTYHRTKPTLAKKRSNTIAFSGFWGPGKGIETLLDAWEQLPNSSLQLTISGDPGSKNDAYAKVITDRIRRLNKNVSTTGFIDDLDDFLGSLNALILPYWPELPSGTSAMSMRAAELATPIIASDTPALRLQLGDEGATYVTPRDASALAKAITQLEATPELFQKRAEAVQSRVFSYHNWESVSKRLEQIIGEVLAS